MSKINKKLCQLEAIYELNNHISNKVDCDVIKSYIDVIFEHSNEYGINGLSKEWFDSYKKKSPIKASNFIYNVLRESGNTISKQSIFESISA